MKYMVFGPQWRWENNTYNDLLGRVFSNHGHIFLDGHTVDSNNKSFLSKFGVVSQFDNLDPDFTVIENLSIYSSYFKIKKIYRKKSRRCS